MLLCTALCANFLFVRGHNHQRLLEIAALSATGLLVLAQRLPHVETFGGTHGKFIAAFFTLGIVSSLSAFRPQYAVFEVSTVFLLYVLAKALAGEIARRGAETLHLVIQAVGAMAALYTLNFVFDYLGSVSLGLPVTLTDLTTGFSNIRFFNHAQTATLPLLILLCCLAPRVSKLRWLWLAATTYWWMVLFATSGRGTLVGMAAGSGVIAILLRRKALPYLKQVVSTAFIGLLAYFVLLVAVPEVAGGQGMSAFSSLFERTASDPTSRRTFLWERAATLIAEHPFLGVGPMHFAHNAGDLHTGAHPHDWLLQIGAEWGLPALACLVTALVLGLRTLLRAGTRIDEEDAANQTTFAAVLTGAVAILVDGLVSGLFVMPQSQLAIALFLGCTMGWYQSVVPTTTAACVSHSASRLAGAILIIAAMAGMAYVWPEMLARLQDQPLTATQHAANTGLQWPRLWKAGFF
jgi:putative inorganic carbon (HCO3(-)) transporter